MSSLPTPHPNAANAAIHVWYDDHAADFEDTAAIEIPFVGLSPEAQDRLNRFKLHALDVRVALEGRTVLEFGAGHGRLALTYPGMASYTGVDYSQNLVALGTRRLEAAGLADRARLVYGDVLGFRGDPASFDVVCSLGMLTYFPDAAEPVTAMARYVRPGGTLFFDFRCTSPLYDPIRAVKWALKKPTGGVSYVANARHIAALLRELGFERIEIVSREFPLLAGLHARRGWDWPLALRNRIAASSVLRTFATEVWAFATKRP